MDQRDAKDASAIAAATETMVTLRNAFELGTEFTQVIGRTCDGSPSAVRASRADSPHAPPFLLRRARSCCPTSCSCRATSIWWPGCPSTLGRRSYSIPPSWASCAPRSRE